MRAPIVSTLALLSLGGCVSLGTHEELIRIHSETKERLADSQLDLAMRDKELDAAKSRGVELQAALDAEQKKSAELAAAKQALEGQLATAQSEQQSARGELRATQAELAQVVKDRSALKGSVEEMKQALDELARRKAEADRRIGEYRALLDRFKALIDAGQLKVKIVDRRMVVQLQSDVLFASGSASLSKDGKVSVVEVARVLADIPGKKFQVEGHTDNVPIKTEQFPANWELASARALTVLRAMTDGGLAADRVSAASFGDTKPAARNDTPEGKAQNRRIEIVVVPDLASLPGFEELQKAGG